MRRTFIFKDLDFNTWAHSRVTSSNLRFLLVKASDMQTPLFIELDPTQIRIWFVQATKQDERVISVWCFRSQMWVPPLIDCWGWAPTLPPRGISPRHRWANESICSQMWDPHDVRKEQMLISSPHRHPLFSQSHSLELSHFPSFFKD